VSAGHTPGPWHWVPANKTTSDLAKLVGENGMEVCNFGNDETYYPTEGMVPSAPDADLIAAAPALLDALEGLCARWQGNPDNYAHGEQIKEARAAIAKATGKEMAA
jgi:hypothetical protein